MRHVRKHIRIWLRMALMSLGQQLSYGIGSLGFLARSYTLPAGMSIPAPCGRRPIPTAPSR